MMKKEFMFIAGLYTLIQSIAIGCSMVYMAVTNNPQGEFYTESGVVWGDIATVFVSRFVGSAVFCSAIFVSATHLIVSNFDKYEVK